eukprot:TRINITY_DN6582_c0_g2_i2.p3 TRINITY_DN6582_c0_g2~~TRINITY_DN6582_c0_g2_i2.p3  ORF type:complete len:275 (+),score=-27.43 TRINITY_DN6582_c0_g2_i2:328-1152(+)
MLTIAVDVVGIFKLILRFGQSYYYTHFTPYYQQYYIFWLFWNLLDFLIRLNICLLSVFEIQLFHGKRKMSLISQLSEIIIIVRWVFYSNNFSYNYLQYFRFSVLKGNTFCFGSTNALCYKGSYTFKNYDLQVFVSYNKVVLQRSSLQYYMVSLHFYTKFYFCIKCLCNIRRKRTCDNFMTLVYIVRKIRQVHLDICYQKLFRHGGYIVQYAFQMYDVLMYEKHRRQNSKVFYLFTLIPFSLTFFLISSLFLVTEVRCMLLILYFKIMGMTKLWV